MFFCFLIKLTGVSKSFTIFFFYTLFDNGLKFIGPINVKDIVLIVFLIILFNKRMVKKYKYPFYYCSLLSVVSYCISAYMASEPHWPFMILKCMRYFMLPVCFYYFIIKVNNGVIYFSKHLLWFSTFIVLYSILELTIGTSPIVNFINDYNGDGYNMDEAFRYGVKRIQTVFIHSTALGYYCVTASAFLLLCVDNNIRRLNKISDLNYWLVIFGLAIITFLTGTRSAMIPLVFIYLWYTRNKILNIKYLIWYIILLFALFITAQIYLSDYFDTVLDSILNTNDNAVGSSTDMRQVQFAIALYYFLQAPVFGNGTSFTFDVVTPINPDMYGAESVWMPLMIDNGIVGCIAYLLCYVYCFIYILQNKNKIDCIFTLGLILFINTATSVPGFDVGYIFILTLCFAEIQYYKIQSD